MCLANCLAYNLDRKKRGFTQVERAKIMVSKTFGRVRFSHPPLFPVVVMITGFFILSSVYEDFFDTILQFQFSCFVLHVR